MLAELVERITYAAALGYFRAYFETKAALAEAHKEVPTDEDRARAARFRAAVERLRRSSSGGSGPVDPAPSRGVDKGLDLGNKPGGPSSEGPR